MNTNLRKVVQDKEEVISELRRQNEDLHGNLKEKECHISSLNEKVLKLESVGKEARAKLDSAASEISKLSTQVHTKVANWIVYDSLLFKGRSCILLFSFYSCLSI